MKRILNLLAIILPALIFAQDETGSIRAGAGYSHDFPGMNGYSSFIEYSHTLTERWQAACGARWTDMQGFPRTKEVKEFTRGFGVDFNIYFLPIANESHQLRLGTGFTFSFYDINRAYPAVVSDGDPPTITWASQHSKGRSSGMNVSLDYGYSVPNSNLILGVRGALSKVYDEVFFAGAFVGVKL